MSGDLKRRLLEGRKPRPFTVATEEAGEIEISLRPLSAPEAGDVQAALMAPYKTANTRDASLEDSDDEPEVGRVRKPGRRTVRSHQETIVEQSEVVRAFYRSCVLATAYGLVDPEMTVEEVESWRDVPAIEKIGQEVMARSGLGKDPRSELRRFRELDRGTENPPAPSVGEPSDADSE